MKINNPFILALITGCFVLSSSALAQYNPFKDPAQSRSATELGASGPDLSATKPTIEAGQITVGVTSYVVTVFKNNGTAPVKVGAINLYPSSTVSAQVSLNQCKDGMVPPEAECAVSIAVTGLQPGTWRVELLVNHNGRTRLATASISGTVESGGDQAVQMTDIETSPSMLDFGKASGGLPMVRSVVFRNRTGDTLKVQSIGIDTPASSGLSVRTGCPEELKPGESCNVAVTWTPRMPGVAQGILMFRHSGKSSLTQVEITGSFEPGAMDSAPLYPSSIPDRGLLISDRKEFDFGTDIRGAVAMTTSLVNMGSKPVRIQSIRMSGYDSGISIARSGCRPGRTLQPVEACALTLNWSPARAGSVVDDVQIAHDGARGILVLPVRGSATGPVSRDSVAVRQTIIDDNGESIEAIAPTPVLDGYVVSSHAPSRAVINGPVGSLVVREGESIVIAGVKWDVTIVRSGVILTSGPDEILLVFDRSLKPATPTQQTSSEPRSSSGLNALEPSTTFAD